MSADRVSYAEGVTLDLRVEPWRIIGLQVISLSYYASVPRRARLKLPFPLFVFGWVGVSGLGGEQLRQIAEANEFLDPRGQAH